MRINDSHTLGIVSGIIGGLVMLGLDNISFKQGYSKRSYSHSAAGMWVNSKRQARSTPGNILGIGMSLGLSGLGGIIFQNIIKRGGTDNIITKGLFYGAVWGGIITAFQSSFPKNKIKPRDSSSNLSYVLCNMTYGIVTTMLIKKLGTPLKKLNNSNISNIANPKSEDMFAGDTNILDC